MAATNHYASAQFGTGNNAHIPLNKNNFLSPDDHVSNDHSPSYMGADQTARHRHFRQLQSDVAVHDGRLHRHRLPLGVPRLDSALAGGLARGRVHMLCMGARLNPEMNAYPEMNSRIDSAYGAITGFTICLLRHLMARPSSHAVKNTAPDGPIVWCPAASSSGSGMLYGAGLAALGLDPGRLLIVDAPSPNRRLEVLEDILRTEGLTAVVAEYDHLGKSSDYWMRLARRAQLATEASGTTGFLLGAPVAASGFETIWHVAPTRPDDPARRDDESDVKPASSGQSFGESSGHSSWHPSWAINLVHARGGRPCQTRLSWNRHNNKLTPLADQQQGIQQGVQQGAQQETQMDFMSQMRPGGTVISRVMPKPDRDANHNSVSASTSASANTSANTSANASADHRLTG